MEFHSEVKKQAKLCLVGDLGVGKTNMVLRFASDSFEVNHRNTIGAAFQSKSIEIDGETLQFEIWDTAGQEKYRSIMPMYYRGAAAAIVVYDITSEESFQYMKTWVEELTESEPNAKIAIAGNKIDLERKREVSYNAGKLYADQICAIFMETSAKTGESIEELFIEIGRALPPERLKHPKQALKVRDEDEAGKHRTTCCK